MTAERGPAVLARATRKSTLFTAARQAGETPGFNVGPLWMRALPPLVTFGVLMTGLTVPSFWRDEAATLAAIHRPFGAMLAMLGHVDAVHGAYYVLAWVLARLLGTGELALRLPSVIAMCVAAGFIAAIGRRLVSPGAGLAAGVVFVINPQIVFYGQDARSYALVTMAAVIASYVLVRAAAAPSGDRRRWWAWYGASIAVLGILNIFGLLLVAAHGVTVALRCLRAGPQNARPADGLAADRSFPAADALPQAESAAAAAEPGPDAGAARESDGAPAPRQPAGAARPAAAGTGSAAAAGPASPAARPDRDSGRALLRGWLGAALAGCAAASPLVYLGYRQQGQVSWLRTPTGLSGLGQLIGTTSMEYAVAVILAAGLAVGVIGRSRRLRAAWPGVLGGLALPWIILPAAILLAGSLIHPVYTFRYVAFCIPAVALLIGAAVAALGRIAGVVAVLVLAVLSLSPQLLVRQPGGHKDDIRQADQIVAANRLPGDVVLYTNPNAESFGAAYRDGLRKLPNIALARQPVPSGTLAGTDAAYAVVRQRMTTVSRVWVVDINRDSALVTYRKQQLLGGLHFRQVFSWRTSDLWLHLYARATSRAAAPARS